jgi:hypothetical protein
MAQSNLKLPHGTLVGVKIRINKFRLIDLLLRSLVIVFFRKLLATASLGLLKTDDDKAFFRRDNLKEEIKTSPITG